MNHINIIKVSAVSVMMCYSRSLRQISACTLEWYKTMLPAGDKIHVMDVNL